MLFTVSEGVDFKDQPLTGQVNSKMEKCQAVSCCDPVFLLGPLAVGLESQSFYRGVELAASLRRKRRVTRRGRLIVRIIVLVLRS